MSTQNLRNAIFMAVLLSLATTVDAHPTFTGIPIDVSGGAIAWSVDSADVNGDGNMDFLASVDLAVRWYQYDGIGDFTVHDVATGSGFVSVVAADVDQDGDTDIVSTIIDFSGGGDHIIAWHENDGELTPAFTTRVAYGVVPISPIDVTVADVDSDGDVDILAASASGFVMWLESDLIPEGACCLPTGNCSTNTEVSGLDAHGTYQGDTVACGSVSCPPAIEGDFDFDGDVDLIDFRRFQENFTGP